ncbi:MAG: hypothetical protein WDM91_19480 [Rhizomicrobium sp.]
MSQTCVSPAIDLDRIYREVLAEVHRAFVFMRLGHRGVSLWHFDETELPGSLRILVVPEPMPEHVLKEYNEQYVSWILGNGLRDLVEAFAHFLDQIYDSGLTLAPSVDQAKRMKKFERVSLGAKVKILKDEFQVEGIYARHFESFVSARNALAHGSGVVRQKHCTDGDELVITWLGLDPSLLASDGNRYEANKLPAGAQFVEPLRHERPVRERRWRVGERIRLTAMDLAEITYMASHEAIDVCDALSEYALKQGIRLKQVTIIRGGSDDPQP